MSDGEVSEEFNEHEESVEMMIVLKCVNSMGKHLKNQGNTGGNTDMYPLDVAVVVDATFYQTRGLSGRPAFPLHFFIFSILWTLNCFCLFETALFTLKL